MPKSVVSVLVVVEAEQKPKLVASELEVEQLKKLVVDIVVDDVVVVAVVEQTQMLVVTVAEVVEQTMKWVAVEVAEQMQMLVVEHMLMLALPRLVAQLVEQVLVVEQQSVALQVVGQLEVGQLEHLLEQIPQPVREQLERTAEQWLWLQQLRLPLLFSLSWTTALLRLHPTLLLFSSSLPPSSTS